MAQSREVWNFRKPTAMLLILIAESCLSCIWAGYLVDHHDASDSVRTFRWTTTTALPFRASISSPSHELGHFGHLLKQANTSRDLPGSRTKPLETSGPTRIPGIFTYQLSRWRYGRYQLGWCCAAGAERLSAVVAAGSASLRAPRSAGCEVVSCGQWLRLFEPRALALLVPIRFSPRHT
eukprot:3328071-Prymnesium_polylepis.2